jgi:riboflavin biosynthesis pyrimidine reductase
MALVTCDMSMSVDGYVTGPNDSHENPFGDGAGMLHDWMFSAATDDDRALLQEMVDGVGAIVMGKVVGLHGATVMQQALPLGLVDEGRVHVIPVLLGGGTPLFGPLDSSITLERTNALVTPAATHIGFRVVR